MVKKGIYGMKRPCNRCEIYFQPSSKGTRICDKCIVKSLKKRMEKNKLMREKLLNDGEKRKKK